MWLRSRKFLLFCILLVSCLPRATPRSGESPKLLATSSDLSHKRLPRNAFSHRFNSSSQYVLQSREFQSRNSTNSSIRPRFGVPRDTELQFHPDDFICDNELNLQCRNKTTLFRKTVLREFRRMISLFEEKITEDFRGSLNGYNVSFDPLANVNSGNKSICLSKLKIRMLNRGDLSEDVSWEKELRDSIPQQSLFPSDKRFKTCAVVSSAGSLANSKLGAFIDGHDLVMRFNHAPTQGFEEDVGTKTDIRIVNSQVVTKPEFDFLHNPLFRNISIAAWDPGRYKGSLGEWIQRPDYDMFPIYRRFMQENPHGNAHVVDPRSLWHLWESLQSYFPHQRIRQNPPSSGFVGIVLLLPHCDNIDVVEYIPSTRLAGRCHYYEPQHNPMCTFGSWHPLAAEKLMMLDYNTADEFTTFQRGILRVKANGFKC